MAKRITKKNKKTTSTKPKPIPHGQRYDVLAPSYRTKKGFEGAVDQRARSQIQPELDEAMRQRRDLGRTHTGRVGDINDFYGAETQARRDAATSVGNTLNQLITSSQALDQGSADALRAALRGTQVSDQAARDMIGNAGSANNLDAIARGLDSGSKAGGVGMLSQFANIGAGAARDIGIAGVGQRQAGEEEGRRYDAGVKENYATRRALYARLPELRTTARSELGSEEREKRAQAFQERIGGKELSLKERAQTESERQGASERSLGERSQTLAETTQRQSYSINQQQLGIQRQQLQKDQEQADSEEGAADAKARAERFNNGVTILQNYLKPTKGELGKTGNLKSKTWRSRRRYDDAIRQIRVSTGMGYEEARQVLLTSNIPEWVRRARLELSTKQKVNRQEGPYGSPH